MADLSPFATLPPAFVTRDGIQVDRQYLSVIEQLASQFGVKVNSGYRTKDQNTAAGGADGSDHLTGDAVDFTGSPDALRALYTYAQGKFPYIEPWGDTGGSHVHISFARGGSSSATTPPSSVPAWDPSHPDASASAPVSGALYGDQLLRQINTAAQQYGIDPNVLLAVAPHEGGFQGAVGDQGTSFGPWQLHAGGALPADVWAQGADYAKKWANSPAGINYAVQSIAKVVGTQKGPAAVRAVVTNFERPAQQYVEGEVAKSLASYGAGPTTIPTVPTIPAAPTLTADTTPTPIAGLPPVTGTLPAALATKPHAALPLKVALQLLGMKPGRMA